MSKTNEEVVEIPSDLETEPAKELTEDELMTKHAEDLSAWLTERKLMIVPQISDDVVPVGAMGQGVQFFAVWSLAKSR